MLVSALYNIVDRIYMGQGVDPLAIAGIGLVMPVMMVVYAFSMLVGIGANALFAIRMGEKRYDEIEKIMGHAFILLLIIPAVCAGCALIFMEPILRNVMKADGQMYDYAATYLRITLYGGVFGAMGMGLTHFIRSDGHPKTSMLVQVVGALINIILDPVFIFVLDLGVAGAAWVTVISQFVTLVFVLGYFSSRWTRLRFRVKYMKLDPALTAKILAMGFAPFIMQFAMSLVGMLQNAVILRYGGEDAFTAMTIFFSILIVIVMPLMGIAQGAQPIMGYNYGAKQYDRVKKCFALAFIACTSVLVFGFAVMQIAPAFCFSLFSADTGNLRELGILTMRICTIMHPVVGIQMMGGQLFQAIGKPAKATVLSLSRQIIFLIPAILFLPVLFETLDLRAIYGVYVAFPVSDFCAAIISCVLVYREFESWKKLAA
jgi:putative MATE family efflux protein